MCEWDRERQRERERQRQKQRPRGGEEMEKARKLPGFKQSWDKYIQNLASSCFFHWMLIQNCLTTRRVPLPGLASKTKWLCQLQNDCYLCWLTTKPWCWKFLSLYIFWTPTQCHHHHHIVLAARISLTLSRHSSLSFIALGRSSGQQPVSSHSCWMYVRAGRPAFARPCVGIHKSTSLMSSSLLLQQCPACLVRLTWIVFVIGGRWPYSWCLVGCCCQDLFRIARSILV